MGKVAIALVAAMLLTGLMAGELVRAEPVASGTVDVIADVAPFYFFGVVAYSVYAPGDPDNPYYSAAEYTYVYTLSSVAATPPAGSFSLPISTFRLGVPNGDYSAVVSPDDGDPNTIAPSEIDTASNPNKVQIRFNDPPIYAGESSQAIVLTSPLAQGEVVFDVESGGIGEDEVGVGPVPVPPEIPRTIGYWKNQFLKNLHIDPPELAVMADSAAALSDVFADADELEWYVTSKGKRPMLTRAKQHYGALLMNIAANYLADNTALASTLTLSTNVGAAIDEIEFLIQSPLEEDVELAKNLADDINNDLGVGTN